MQRSALFASLLDLNQGRHILSTCFIPSQGCCMRGRISILSAGGNTSSSLVRPWEVMVSLPFSGWHKNSYMMVMHILVCLFWINICSKLFMTKAVILKFSFCILWYPPKYMIEIEKKVFYSLYRLSLNGLRDVLFVSIVCSWCSFCPILVWEWHISVSWKRHFL